MEIKNDIESIREAGADLSNLSREINEIIDELFEKIKKLPTTAGGWAGLGADKFVYDALVDKGEYIAVKKRICYMGKYLNDYANELEARINEVKK